MSRTLYFASNLIATVAILYFATHLAIALN